MSVNDRLAKSAAMVAIVATTLLACGRAEAEPRTYFRMNTPEFLETIKLGYEKFTEFQCAKCHAIREGQPMNKEIIAPNLTLARKRLRPDWMLQWMIDPQSLQPGTKMPNYFAFNEDEEKDYAPIYHDELAHQYYEIIVAVRNYTLVIGTDLDPGYDPDAPMPVFDWGTDEDEKPADVQDWEDQYYGY